MCDLCGCGGFESLGNEGGSEVSSEYSRVDLTRWQSSTDSASEARAQRFLHKSYHKDRQRNHEEREASRQREHEQELARIYTRAGNYWGQVQNDMMGLGNWLRGRRGR